MNNKIIRAAWLGTAIVGALWGMPSTAVAGCGTEDYMGSICMTAATYCPRGYAEANGQIMAISTNQALFALLGTNYGGDGRTTFGLPDLRGRTPVGVGTGSGMNTVVAGQKRGNEISTMSIANMAPHNHSAAANGGSVSIPVSADTQGNVTAPDGQHPYLSASGGGPGQATIWSSSMTSPVSLQGEIKTISVAVGSTGMGQPFSNLPPQIGVRYCIATQGLFPPRE